MTKILIITIIVSLGFACNPKSADSDPKKKVIQNQIAQPVEVQQPDVTPQAAEDHQPSKTTSQVKTTPPVTPSTQVVSTPSIKKKPKVKKRKEGLMTVSVAGLATDSVLPRKYAFCTVNKKGRTFFAKNISPQISWDKVPPETKSFAVVMHDSKAPMKLEDVNQKEKTLTKKMPRVSFFHWILVNIPADKRSLKEGIDSQKVVNKGKAVGQQAHGLRGLNSYTYWFKKDPQMKGLYAGYDGPCPPWNDEVVHEYYFTVYALDVEKLTLPKNFTGPKLLRAMQGHVITQAHTMLKYKTNVQVNY